MKGRLYIICTPDNKAVLTDDIEPLGSGLFKYMNFGVIPTIAEARDIFCFADQADFTHNSLSKFITRIWRARYNLQKGRIAGVFPSGCAVSPTDKKRSEVSKSAQLFDCVKCKSMKGDIADMYIGSEGDLIIDHMGAMHPAHVIWDECLAPHDYCRIYVFDDGFKYKVCYKDIEKKPPVGFGRISNVIYNYISAFPDGISSRDIENGLNMRHPSVAGRISEMDKTGRIHRVDSIKYHPQGKANSIWVISIRE